MKAAILSIKPNLIAYLINNPDKVHLITRPRRFGKNLELKHDPLFSGRSPAARVPAALSFPPKTPLPPPPEILRFNTPPSTQSRTQNAELRPPNAYLFNNLIIASHPRCAEFMAQYPVIHISFKDVKKINI